MIAEVREIVRLDRLIKPSADSRSALWQKLVNELGSHIADALGDDYPEVWKKGVNTPRRYAIYTLATLQADMLIAKEWEKKLLEGNYENHLNR